MTSEVYMLKPDVANFRVAVGKGAADVRMLMTARKQSLISETWVAPTLEWISETTGRPRPDFGSCGGGIDLLSRRAANLLRDFICSNGEYLDVDGLDGGYVGFHTIRFSDALDLERSKCSINKVSKQVTAIWNAVLRKDKLEGFDIFRINGNSSCYFTSEFFRDRVTGSGLTGFRFERADVV